MRKLFLIILVFIGIYTLNAQTAKDSITLSNDNCATRLSREYMIKMGTVKNDENKTIPLNSKEILTGLEFESAPQGIFIVSTFSAHRRKFIVLKKNSQIKLLTFKDAPHSLIDVISFLQEIQMPNEKIVDYLDSLIKYLKKSKNGISSEKHINDSDWITCD